MAPVFSRHLATLWPPSGRRMAAVLPPYDTEKHHRRHAPHSTAQHSPTPLGSRPQSPTTGHDAVPCTTHHARLTTHHAPRTTHHMPHTTYHTPRTTHGPATAPAGLSVYPDCHHALYSQPQVHGTSVLLVVQSSTLNPRLTRSLASSTPPFTKFSHGNPRLR